MRPSNILPTSTFLIFGLLVAVMLTPTIAAAEDGDEEMAPMYIEYMAGFSHVPNQDIKGPSSASIRYSAEADHAAIGYFVGAALGQRFADSDFGTGLGSLRAEIQIGYRSSDTQSLSVQGEVDKAKGSTVSLFSAMANGYFDFDLGGDGKGSFPVVPWIGAGIGWGMPRLDAQNGATAMQLAVEDTDSIFVYNVMTGITYRISKQAELNVGYRYIATTKFKVLGKQSGVRQRFEYNFTAHEFFTGIRFFF